MSLTGAWTRYWFREGALLDLAVCRIVIVGFQLVHLAAFDLDGLIARAGEAADLYQPLPIVRALGGGDVPDASTLVAVWAATIAVGLAAWVGLATRASLWIFTAGLLFLHGCSYSFGIHRHPEALIVIATAILAVGPSGEHLAVDARRQRRRARAERSSRDAAWPRRLVQWLLVLAYFSAFCSKVGKGGTDWVNGYTLQYVTFVKGMELGRPFGVWLSEHHGLCVALSWATLAFEGTFALAVLAPRLTPWYLAAGVLFHLGIELAMAASFFQYIALYAVFVPWGRIRRRLLALHPTTGRPPPGHRDRRPGVRPLAD